MTELSYEIQSGAALQFVTKYCANTNLCRAKAAENYIECNAGGDTRLCVWCCSDENKCNDDTGTLQFVPLERPAFFAFPERSSTILISQQVMIISCAAEYVGHAWFYVINPSAQAQCIQ